MLTIRTHDIMIFGGMNGKLASENFFWEWILLVEGEKDEMGIINSRDKIAIEQHIITEIPGRIWIWK